MKGLSYLLCFVCFCSMLSPLVIHPDGYRYWRKRRARERFHLIACSVQLISSWTLTGHMVGIKKLVEMYSFCEHALNQRESIPPLTFSDVFIFMTLYTEDLSDNYFCHVLF